MCMGERWRNEHHKRKKHPQQRKHGVAFHRRVKQLNTKLSHAGSHCQPARTLYEQLAILYRVGWSEKLSGSGHLFTVIMKCVPLSLTLKRSPGNNQCGDFVKIQDQIAAIISS